jgi:hypothetical protein
MYVGCSSLIGGVMAQTFFVGPFAVFLYSMMRELPEISVLSVMKRTSLEHHLSFVFAQRMAAVLAQYISVVSWRSRIAMGTPDMLSIVVMNATTAFAKLLI